MLHYNKFTDKNILILYEYKFNIIGLKFNIFSCIQEYIVQIFQERIHCVFLLIWKINIFS